MEAVGVVTSGRAALAYLEDDRPDVILLDLGLPDRSGLAVGREILESWPEAKLVVLTALDDPKAVEEAMRAGFRGYLTKDTPVSRFVELDRGDRGRTGGVPSPLRTSDAAPRPYERQRVAAHLPADRRGSERCSGSWSRARTAGRSRRVSASAGTRSVPMCRAS